MTGKSGTLVFSLVLGIASFVGLSAIPTAVFGQTGNSIQSQASTDGGVQDCTDGCYISTCDSHGKCTVWYCDSSGCSAVGSYQKIGPESQPARIGAVAMNSYDEVAFTKTCSGDRCMLYELTPTKVTQMGYVENLDEIVRRLRARHAINGG